MNNQKTTKILIGNSPAMTRVKESIGKFAPSDSTIFITGPSGSGKGLAAEFIHRHSSRSRGPFVRVNCGALPETLVESELFGNARGAFTGALAPRIGRFERAEGGTIFLDEIGEMQLSAQVKLLTALEERYIQRLGENEERHINCRVIAAANIDLKAACSEGKFRLDLYYRLKVANIDMPPLNERTEDIPLLVDFFLEKLTINNYGPLRPAIRMSDEALDAIMHYRFPGDVRELKHMIERAILLSGGELICAAHLPKEVQQNRKN